MSKSIFEQKRTSNRGRLLKERNTCIYIYKLKIVNWIETRSRKYSLTPLKVVFRMGEKNSSIKFSGLGVADIDIGKQQRNNSNNLATADRRNESI